MKDVQPSNFDATLALVEGLDPTADGSNVMGHEQEKILRKERAKFESVRRIGHDVELSPRLALLFGMLQ